MPTVADVLGSDPKPSWHESVALVQEIASQLGPDPVPAPEDLLLEEDGTLTFGFAGESSRPQVADLADLLERLLSGVTAPPSLIDLAHENARPEPAHATLAGFCRALKFYERPNRTVDLAAVGGRLAAALGRPEPSLEVEAPVLTDPVRSDPETPAPASAPPRAGLLRLRASSWVHRFSPRELAFGGSAILLMIVLGVAGVLLGLRPSEPDRNGATVDTPAPPPATATVLPDGDRSAPSASAPQTQEHTRVRHSADTASRPAPHTRPPDRHASARPAIRAGAGFQTLSLPWPPVPLQWPLAASDLSLPEPRVYSTDDPGVKPPRMRRHLLPDVAPDAAAGYLEVVVDAQGDVESVKLLGPAMRMQDFGLIAAAKAWKFMPATFEGRPVKYRLRVPIPSDGSQQ